MKFGGFVFPFTPSHIEVKTDENISLVETIDGKIITKHRGNKPIEVRCKGEFFGSRALENYNRLREMCAKGKEQVLSVPGHKSFYAICTSVKFIGQGGGKVIEYQASFVEKEAW